MISKFLTVIFLFITSLVFGQVISEKTNGIKLNFNDSLQIILPEVDWVNPIRENTGTEDNSVRIRAIINSQAPIKSVLLEIMNPAFEQPIVKNFTVPQGATYFDVDQVLTLMPGSNSIGLIANTENGGEVKGIRTIRLGKNNNLLDVMRKDYALLIATDKYDNWGDLVNPIFDARVVGDILKEKYGFQVEILKDPTQEEIILALRKYSTRQFNDQDQLFVFFAGHGQFDTVLGDGYIVTADSKKNDPTRTSYIAHANLRQYINNIGCKHIFVTMDVCFGGTFDEKLVTKRSIYENLEDSEWLARKLTLTSRLYLTSGGKEYVPDGIPGHHSPFAKKLIEALNSNGDDDQVLTVSEMLSYFAKLQPVPRSGSWGDNEPGSDFLFIVE